MSSSTLDEVIIVPPQFDMPTGKDDAIRLGYDLSHGMGKLQWELGWAAAALFPTDEVILFGDLTFQGWCAVAGRSRARVNKMRWVASRFTRAEVGSLPKLTFSHFETVTAAIETLGRESVLDMLAEAAEKGWSVETLEREVKGNVTDDEQLMPLAIRGAILDVKEERDGKNLPTGRGWVTLYVDDFDQWETAIIQHGLDNTKVDAVIRPKES